MFWSALPQKHVQHSAYILRAPNQSQPNQVLQVGAVALLACTLQLGSSHSSSTSAFA